MTKKKLVVIFGGRSSEHEVSCISVQTVAKAVDTDKYDMTLIGITKDGKWLKADSIESIADGSWYDSQVRAVISPDSAKEIIIKDGDRIYAEPVDVIFPVLHGLYGEDGTIQGLFEMADIPYVGCGVFASAAAMDKFHTKIIADHINVTQAKFVPVVEDDFDDLDVAMDRVESELNYPVFVKPSSAGSSKGVTKAHDRAELEAGLHEALNHDSKILVEETIIGRELECGVLGYGNHTKASGVGEILAAADADFYDFDAKYKKYNITKRKRESIAANYLKSLLSARLVDINQSVLNDYIDFSLQLCKPVDILAGKKRIVKLHNEITDEIIEKSNKLSKITIPETPLKYLKLPKEFVLLKSQKALINEGRINHNCVGAYGQDIISGKCVIYSANIQNEHLTIEIKFIKIKNEYKFYVAQCYKACNIPCSPDILAYVRECLAKCSDKAIKKYIKAVKKMKHSPVRNGKEAK